MDKTKKTERQDVPTPTPEDIAKAMLRLPPDHKWKYLGKEKDTD